MCARTVGFFLGGGGGGGGDFCRRHISRGEDENTAEEGGKQDDGRGEEGKIIGEDILGSPAG